MKGMWQLKERKKKKKLCLYVATTGATLKVGAQPFSGFAKKRIVVCAPVCSLSNLKPCSHTYSSSSAPLAIWSFWILKTRKQSEMSAWFLKPQIRPLGPSTEHTAHYDIMYGEKNFWLEVPTGLCALTIVISLTIAFDLNILSVERRRYDFGL